MPRSWLRSLIKCCEWIKSDQGNGRQRVCLNSENVNTADFKICREDRDAFKWILGHCVTSGCAPGCHRSFLCGDTLLHFYVNWRRGHSLVFLLLSPWLCLEMQRILWSSSKPDAFNVFDIALWHCQCLQTCWVMLIAIQAGGCSLATSNLDFSGTLLGGMGRESRGRWW